MKLFILFSLLASSALANRVSCEVLMNDSKVFSNQVETTTNKKVLIGEMADWSAYVIEKADGVYTLEAYLPGSDARVYSTGLLKQVNDKLTASLWGRDILIDLSCDLM